MVARGPRDNQGEAVAGGRHAADRAPAAQAVVDPDRRSAPVVDGGAHPTKRCAGDQVAVSATIFRDGIRRFARACGTARPRRGLDGGAPRDRCPDRYSGSFLVGDLGYHHWQLVAWVERFASWRDELSRKLLAGQKDTSSELAEGIELLRALAARARGSDREAVLGALATVADATTPARVRQQAALADALLAIAERHPSTTTRHTVKPSRSRSSESGRVSVPGTSSFPARGAASRAYVPS